MVEKRGKREKERAVSGSGGVENMGISGSGPTSTSMTWLALVGGRDLSRQD